MTKVYPSCQTVSTGRFSTSDIKMTRFSNNISISIHKRIPDMVAYQVFLQILFRLPEANAKNWNIFEQNVSKYTVSYTLHHMRLAGMYHDARLNLKMLHEMGVTLDDADKDENVKDFVEIYIPDFSIRYYTCESFIFTLINDAFQSKENLDSLIKLRMIVTDLYNLINVKLGDFIPNNVTTIGPFYKAEVMSTNKLRKLKEGINEYITFHSFLSTTTNKSRALDFIHKKSSLNQDQVVLLYEIEFTDGNCSQKLIQPFANITILTCTKHEPEIFFSIGQIFKIRSVIEDKTSKIWIAHLQILAESETEQLNNLTNYYLKEILGQETFYNGIQTNVITYKPLSITTWITVGNYYSSALIKDYEKAKYYYERFLQEDLESPDDFQEQSRPYFEFIRILYLNHSVHGYYNLQLANILIEQEQYLEAYQYNQKAHNAFNQVASRQPIRMFLAEVYNTYANILRKYARNYDEALHYYLYALQQNRNNFNTFINIGFLEIEGKDYWHAMSAFQTALSVLEEFNETNYLALGQVHYGMGIIYHKLNYYHKALLSFLEAKILYEFALPSNHVWLKQINEEIDRHMHTREDYHEEF